MAQEEPVKESELPKGDLEEIATGIKMELAHRMEKEMDDFDLKQEYIDKELARTEALLTEKGLKGRLAITKSETDSGASGDAREIIEGTLQGLPVSLVRKQGRRGGRDEHDFLGQLGEIKLDTCCDTDPEGELAKNNLTFQKLEIMFDKLRDIASDLSENKAKAYSRPANTKKEEERIITAKKLSDEVVRKLLAE